MGYEYTSMPEKYVSESVLKKRKTVEKQTAASTKRAAALKVKRKQKRKEIFNRAQKYATEYHKLERAEIRARRQAKDGGNFYLEAEPKLALVVRIRGINGVDPKHERSSNSSDYLKSTTLPSFVLMLQPLKCCDWLNHTSLTVIQTWRLFENSSTNVDSLKLMDNVFLSPVTLLLKVNLAKRVSSALKMSSTKSTLLVLTLNELTNFCGLSNLAAQMVDTTERETTLLKEEMLETVKT